MPNAEKVQILEAATEQLRGVRGVYLADFTGLNVAQITMLRQQCRNQGVRFKVIKNTLLKRAFNANGITELDPFLEGPTGVVYSPESETAPAKILSDFAKEHEKPQIKAAIVDGRVYDRAAVVELASLPSHEAGARHPHRADDAVPGRGRGDGGAPRRHGRRAGARTGQGWLILIHRGATP